VGSGINNTAMAVDSGSSARQMQKITIRLAGSMGMRGVAEGIEDEVQARKLHELGCDMGQGWLYARALSAHARRGRLSARAPNGGKVIPLRHVAV